MYPRDGLWISIGYRVLPGREQMVSSTQTIASEMPTFVLAN